MLTGLLTMENFAALVTLTSLEIVLGIDNIVFIAILTGRLGPGERRRAQRLGLAMAMFMRILLLLTIKGIMGLTEPLFTVLGHDLTGKDLILLVGGLFLMAKSTHEIHNRLEGPEPHERPGRQVASVRMAVAQIMLLDLVFSLDSVITAVGMARDLWVMILAVVAAVAIMMVFAGSVTAFIERHPTVKMLALAFLLLIGLVLLLDGMGKHIEKGYIYFAMAFSLFVEMLNLRAGKAAAARRPAA